MILAAVGDTPYNIMKFLHILTIMVAFAPAFVNPLLSAQMRRGDESAWKRTLTYASKNSMKIYGSALIVSGLLGFAMAGMSDKLYSMSQAWLSISAVLWVAMNGVLHALIIPSEKAVGNGDSSAQRKLDIGGGAMTALMLVVLYLMVFKPGL